MDIKKSSFSSQFLVAVSIILLTYSVEKCELEVSAAVWETSLFFFALLTENFRSVYEGFFLFLSLPK